MRGAYYGPKAVPCECGSREAYWHGDTMRVYACSACYSAHRGPTHPATELGDGPEQDYDDSSPYGA